MWIAFLLLIIFPINNKEAYAQAMFNNVQKQSNNKVENNGNDTVKDEKAEFFNVDNKTYKILGEDKNSLEVMLWLCNGSIDIKNIVVDNKVNYNGKIFYIKKIYNKAFIENGNVESITIGNKILGFCDSSGNIIEDSDKIFYNNKKLKSIDLGNVKCTLGKEFFKNCKAMVNIKMSKNIHNIRSKCFSMCRSMETIDLSRIKKISGMSSFEFCTELKDIGEFNEELIELPGETFINCSNLKINSLKNIKKLGTDCFTSCRMLSQDIVEDAEEIGENCFLCCNFSELYLKKAKKIGNNAFGGMESLRKIRFGNSDIPLLGANIVLGSNVNEWIYPKEYENQPYYETFLNKLKVSKVIWNYNYGNFNSEATQTVELNSLKPPNIDRLGYEIEGWYKEQECINKVNRIADLGEIIDSDLVIKNPELYAKWEVKQESKPSEQEEPVKPSEPEKPEAEEEKPKPSEPEKPKAEEEKVKPSEPEKPEAEEEKPKPSEPEKPKAEEEKVKPSEPEKPEAEEEKPKPSEPEKPKAEEEITKPSETEKSKAEEEITKPSEPEKPKAEEEITKPSEPEKPKAEEEPIKPSKPQKQKKKIKLKKRISLNKSSGEAIEDENSKFSRKLGNRLNIKNYIKKFKIKINNENKDINLKKNDTLSLDYEKVKTFIFPIIRNSNVELEVLNWSYTDNANDNIELTKNGVLGEIRKNNQFIGIYLKNNNYFEKGSILKVKFKGNLNLSKLYSFNEELGKFILINDNLKVDNNLIEIKTTNKKQYLITKFDLDEDYIAAYGWNKILPKQSNALLSNHINEISWAYLKREELSKGWIKDDVQNRWYFMNDRGIMETGWIKDKDNNWYYLNEISDGTKGALKTGWNKIDNEWYYLQANGVLAINTVIDGYSVGSDGKLI